MEKSKEGKLQVSEIVHIGVVVNDVEKAIDYYSKHFGWGPWKTEDIHRPVAIVHGKKTSYRCKIASTTIPAISPILLSLDTTTKGTNIFTEHLKAKGEGIHHIQFHVKDLEQEIAKYEKHGFKTLQKVNDAKGGYAYMGTDKVGCIIFEAIGPSPSLDEKNQKSSK